MSKTSILIPEGSRDFDSLKRLQSLPLEQKINLSLRRIEQFYKGVNGKVYISFSGGKDSTVLLHLVRSIYQDVIAVFSDTGLEFPEIRDFVKTVDNIKWLKPKMIFKDVINKYGYPVPSKEVAEKIYQIKHAKSQKTINTRLNGDSKGNGKLSDKWRFLINAPFEIAPNCCHILKKEPFKRYEKETGLSSFVGTMTDESSLRLTNWIRHGCNSFEGRKMSTPLSFWTESDIWEYIKTRGLKYSSVYDMGYERTGCIFCMFGHFQSIESGGVNRFELLRKTHPIQYKYCMENLGLDRVLTYCEQKLQGDFLIDSCKKYKH